MVTQVSTFIIQWVKPETPKINLVSLSGAPQWSFIPGQVAVLGITGIGESYFALASAPEDIAGMEFLVKQGEGISKALYEGKPGDKIQAKGPVGKGFPIDRYPGRDFLLAAVGSAMAPMRSVIRSISKRRRDFGKIIFIYGARRHEDFPCLDEVDDWKKAGIEIILTASRPEGSQWKGETGHVQSHFPEAFKKLTHPVTMICGMKAMQQESREALVSLGVAASEILTNY
jgi:NAD(P)H-flavin reductase